MCPEEDGWAVTAHFVIWELDKIPPLAPMRGIWAETYKEDAQTL